MTDLDDLARRAVGGVTTLAARAARFALKVFLVAAFIAAGSFLLGLVALDGGIRNVWIVLGLGFGGFAVGAVLLARWRLASVGRHAGALITEVKTLLSSGDPAMRTAIETVEAGQRQSGGSVLAVSSDFSSLRETVGDREGQFRNLAAAVIAVTTFPGLILRAIGITLVFALLVPIFLLALVL